ncbi:MAG TPA: TIM44-like domain-containing protein [Solirubrobacteraceae bacterium]
MKRRTLLIALAMAALAALALAPEALAAGGGGSSGFGGGGFHGGGGGRGVGLYILIQILIRLIIFGHGLGALIVIGLLALAFVYVRMAPRFRDAYKAHEEQGPAARRQTALRQRRVELAAAEAAEDDPAFAPDAVRSAATSLFKDIQAAWDADDRSKLGTMVGPDLMREWDRRLDDFGRRGWRNRVEPLGEPTVEYVSLVHRGTAGEDRVVVRLEARLRDIVVDRVGNHIKRTGHMGETVRLREYWTLVRTGASAARPWILTSIEQGAEGQHALGERLVAGPWTDDETLRDQALVEGAVATAVPTGTTVAEVADLDFDGAARAAALDLSVADGRFAPDVLEVAVRRAVRAWAQAVDGDDAPLAAVAEPEARRELLHPGGSDQTRLVVRGPKVTQIRILGLDAAAVPPTMTVGVDVRGARYLEDRDTAAVVAGSRSRSTGFTEHWTFALTDDAQQPWRICAAGAGAAASLTG